jgi:hypothetical protein
VPPTSLAVLLPLLGWIVAGPWAEVAALIALVVVSALIGRRMPRIDPLAAAVAAVVLALSLVPLAQRPEAPSRQLLVVGFDGATWEIVDRLRTEGRLPTFDQTVRRADRREWRYRRAHTRPCHSGTKCWTSRAMLPATYCMKRERSPSPRTDRSLWPAAERCQRNALRASSREVSEERTKSRRFRRERLVRVGQ